jgi:hypothetical protein
MKPVQHHQLPQSAKSSSSHGQSSLLAINTPPASLGSFSSGAEAAIKYVRAACNRHVSGDLLLPNPNTKKLRPASKAQWMSDALYRIADDDVKWLKAVPPSNLDKLFNSKHTLPYGEIKHEQYNVVQVAAYYGSSNVLKFFEEKNFGLENLHKGKNIVLDVVSNGDVDGLQNILEASETSFRLLCEQWHSCECCHHVTPIPVNIENSAAFIAVTENHPRILRFLDDYNSCPYCPGFLFVSFLWEAPDNDEYHPFRIATENGHLDVLRTLHSFPESDILFEQMLDQTELNHDHVVYIAAREGHVDVLRFFLVEAGGYECVNMECQNQTIAHVAAEYGRNKVLELLVELGEEQLLTKPNKYGITPAHAACRYLHEHDFDLCMYGQNQQYIYVCACACVCVCMCMCVCCMLGMFMSNIQTHAYMYTQKQDAHAA